MLLIKNLASQTPTTVSSPWIRHFPVTIASLSLDFLLPPQVSSRIPGNLTGWRLPSPCPTPQSFPRQRSSRSCGTHGHGNIRRISDRYKSSRGHHPYRSVFRTYYIFSTDRQELPVRLPAPGLLQISFSSTRYLISIFVYVFLNISLNIQKSSFPVYGNTIFILYNTPENGTG